MSGATWKSSQLALGTAITDHDQDTAFESVIKCMKVIKLELLQNIADIWKCLWIMLMYVCPEFT